MKRTKINQAKEQLGQEIMIAGWVNIIRDLGNIKFLLIRDISGTIQAVILKDNKEVFAKTKELTLESVVEITGLVKESKQAPGGIEIETKTLEILSQAAPELPIPVAEKTKAETDQSKRLDWRWLDLRRPKQQLIFKVWTAMEQGMREYFLKNGFIQIYSPKFMSSPSEGGSELFEVPYFDRKAYLAQSPQFFKQMAMASGLERVFEVGPVFRAEPSFTTRHATEFTGFDFEMSFIESHQDVMKTAAGFLTAMIKQVKEQYGEEIKKTFKRDLPIPKQPFPQVTMEEAKKILAELKIPSERVGDLSPEEERALSAYFLEKEKHEFVFVTDYPATVRPFYHMRYPDRPKVTKSFDLLWNGVEICTGAQREHRYEILKKQAQEKGVSLDLIKDYLNYFKYGCPPHGGIGLGPARVVMKMLGLPNIQEATYIYRGVKRLNP